MRVLVAVLLIGISLAGCTDDEPVPVPPSFDLDVYRFAYEGSDVFVDGVDHGWLIRVANPSNATQEVAMIPSGVASGVMGPVAQTVGVSPQTAWLPGRIEDNQFSSTLTLEPGESGVFLARIEAYDEPEEGELEHPVSVRVLTFDPTDPDSQLASRVISWTVTKAEQETALVAAGQHVLTTTVGVWTNGTSFYSNAAGALQDPEFPHGDNWTTPEDPTDPLPIYVYNQDREEQPEGSKDTCHFTTITGYNGLLKTQAELSTNVALLRPEAAYTSDASTGHPLYGDHLIFMNTVVAIEASTGTQDELPDPTGACFGDRVAEAEESVNELIPARF